MTILEDILDDLGQRDTNAVKQIIATNDNDDWTTDRSILDSKEYTSQIMFALEVENKPYSVIA